MRFVPLLAALLLAAPPVRAASATQDGTAPAAGAAIDLRIVIPTVLRMRLAGHPATVRVSAEDVARGEVVVRGARVAIVANDRGGYLLRAELRGEAFAGLTVKGLARELHCACTRIDMPMPPSTGRPEAAGVEYRLRLAPQAVPGEYAWPVALTLQNP